MRGTGPDTPAIAALDAAIDAAIAQKRLIGTVVMMAEDGQIIYSRAAGLADRENGIAMQPDTWFRYASVSKPFATMAALQLIQQGRLSPEDPVARWLPDFTPALPDGTRPPITVNHLMSHMAGLDYAFAQPPGGAYQCAGVSDGISERALSLAENIRRIASVPLDLMPGQRWRYSVATDVLGAVIEAVTDSALPFAMAELVTGPLALDAAFFLPDTRNLAVPYVDAQPEPLRMQGVTRTRGNLPEGHSYAFDPDRITDLAAFPSGGGGMAGTAESALLLLEALREGEMLTPTIRAAATTNRITGDHPSRGPGYGHAWAGALVTNPQAAMVELSPGSLIWGGIYGHCWFIDPVRKRTLIALTNTTVEGMCGRFSLHMRRAVAA